MKCGAVLSWFVPRIRRLPRALHADNTKKKASVMGPFFMSFALLSQLYQEHLQQNCLNFYRFPLALLVPHVSDNGGESVNT